MATLTRYASSVYVTFRTLRNLHNVRENAKHDSLTHDVYGEKTPKDRRRKRAHSILFMGRTSRLSLGTNLVSALVDVCHAKLLLLRRHGDDLLWLCLFELFSTTAVCVRLTAPA